MSCSNTPTSQLAILRKMAFIQGKPGQGDALHRALAVLEGHTRKEPGCLEFTFYRALTAPDDFLLVEAFQNAEALATHMREPHTREFFAAGLTLSVRVEELPGAPR